jgi:hypothetical protein
MENRRIKLSIFTKEDFTDKSILDFLSKTNNLSISEYSNFLVSKTLRSELSENILEFISTYDSGFLKPDKCNAYEPINKPFDEDELSEPISWLSQPGGAFYFKRIKNFKIDGAIENHRFAPIWDEGKLLKPKGDESVYLGEIRLFFDEKVLQIKGGEYWMNIITELCNVANAKTGILQLQEENADDQIKDNGIFITKGLRNLFP